MLGCHIIYIDQTGYVFNSGLWGSKWSTEINQEFTMGYKIGK